MRLPNRSSQLRPRRNTRNACDRGGLATKPPECANRLRLAPAIPFTATVYGHDLDFSTIFSLDKPRPKDSGYWPRGGLDGIQKEDCSADEDRKSTRLNSSHPSISYAVFCLKKKIKAPKVSYRKKWLSL